MLFQTRLLFIAQVKNSVLMSCVLKQVCTYVRYVPICIGICDVYCNTCLYSMWYLSLPM